MNTHTLFPTHQRASLTRFVPGPYQPRKRFPEAALAELAASIKALGVMQPILVRPAPGADLDTADFRMEIVAGERRWRASQIAGETEIPFILRDLTTGQVLQMQMIENVQREDLHPLDEAHGYDLLMHPPEGEQPMSLEQVAEVCGKSVSHVRSTVTLCLLVPAARDLFEQGVLSKAIALRLASMPPTIQPRALDAITKAQANQGGKPLTANQAGELLAAKFMLQLKHAPFSVESADLLPAAGACRACPKRTGANPDLFADVPSADTCTDPDCYDAKVAANNVLRVNGARQMGQQVLEGQDALALLKLGPQSDALGGDYIYLDKPAPELCTDPAPLAKALKGYTPKVLILHPTQHTLRPIATVHTVRELLDERGLLVKHAVKQTGGAMDPTTTKTKSDPASKAAAAKASEVERERARTVGVERQFRRVLFVNLADAMAAQGSAYAMPKTVKQLLAAHLAMNVTKGPDLDELCRAWCWDPAVFAQGPQIHTELKRLIGGLQDDDDLDAMLTMLLFIAEDGLDVHDGWRPGDSQPEAMLAAAAAPEFAPYVSLQELRQTAVLLWEDAQPGPAAGGEGAKEGKGKGKGKSPKKPQAPKQEEPPPEQAPEQAPQGAQSLWVGAFVRVKRTKPVGQVVELLTDGDVLVSFISASEREDRRHAVSELELLPGQFVPSEAWPFPGNAS